MKELSSDQLLKRMKVGKVYRRSDLEILSTSVDRDLSKLKKEGKIKKVANGLYVKPDGSAFGALPPSEKTLIKSFLKDERFLVFSLNDYNKLGLGLTQLYNQQIVYNFKRHGEFELGGRKFLFKRVSRFPKSLTREYLLIDLLNNLKNLGDDPRNVLKKLKNKKREFSHDNVIAVAERYGRASARKILKGIFKNV